LNKKEWDILFGKVVYVSTMLFRIIYEDVKPTMHYMNKFMERK